MSLVLVLLFSFILTALEAARIRGATAYISMLSELAGDSFLASYYYPLFEEYRLFGVDAGTEEGYFSDSAIVENLKENITYGTEGLSGGLLKFQGTAVGLTEYKTLMSGGGEEFLAQVRQQIVLDGLSLALEELFSEELFTEASVVGEIYREQEETMAATANVTAELLKLMELVDGIRMKDSGIAFNKDGKMQAKEAFIKQLVPMEQAEVKAAYDNSEVFRTISAGFFRPDRAADRVLKCISQITVLQKKITSLKTSIAADRSELTTLKNERKAEKKLLDAGEKTDDSLLLQLEKEIEMLEQDIEEDSDTLQSYKDQKDTVLKEAKSEYNNLKQKLKAVQSLVEDALDIVDTLEKKQIAAQLVVEAYEEYLEEMKPKLSEELYEIFLQELYTMRVYAGLEEEGYSVETMRQSLQTDQGLLAAMELSGFSESQLSRVSGEMETIINRTGEYTVEGLWFSYGEITVAKTTAENVTGALKELLATGILTLVGVSEEEQSDGCLTGVDLPSASLEKQSMLGELLDCMEEVAQLFRGGSAGDILKTAGNAALDATALELYSIKYFHRFGEESPYTKLNYEREYLVFGAEEDKTNLLSMVLHLIAIRALFAMVMILKMPDRMSRLESLSVGVAGFTGIPVLAAVVKYGLLLLWSVEEALVEVTALMDGKRIAVIGTGTVSFEEIFVCGKARIAEKSKLIPEGIGAAYQDYLVLLSLTRTTREKVYRVLDLIQENIRYRYRDSFRIRNVVTGISFTTKSEAKKVFNTGFFTPEAYELEWSGDFEY